MKGIIIVILFLLGLVSSLRVKSEVKYLLKGNNVKEDMNDALLEKETRFGGRRSTSSRGSSMGGGMDGGPQSSGEQPQDSGSQQPQDSGNQQPQDSGNEQEQNSNNSGRNGGRMGGRHRNNNRDASERFGNQQ